VRRWFELLSQKRESRQVQQSEIGLRRRRHGSSGELTQRSTQLSARLLLVIRLSYGFLMEAAMIWSLLLIVVVHGFFVTESEAKEALQKN
jgi:hypothetical protein